MAQSIRSMLIVGSIIILALAAVPGAQAQEILLSKASEASAPFSTSARLRLDTTEDAFIPVISPAPLPPKGVDWHHLFLSSFTFLAFEQTFRCVTEPGTRDGGYLNAVGNLHGWADGDPFLGNYIGHPMQGSVAGFIWQHNDRAYRDVVFGKNARYWKAKLRGAAFSYLYSVQFEIGPVSEGSLGNIQASCPQQGFVDHVVTPSRLTPPTPPIVCWRAV